MSVEAGPVKAINAEPKPPFAVGNTPVTFAVKSIVELAMSPFTTEPNVGAPEALPCRTVVVVPREPSAAMAWLPAPSMMAFAVAPEAFVVHVAQETVLVEIESGEEKVAVIWLRV